MSTRHAGAIVTKLDGDARGGAALAVKEVSGCPIKFVGMGEKTDALELFYPDRMASRILGGVGLMNGCLLDHGTSLGKARGRAKGAHQNVPDGLSV